MADLTEVQAAQAVKIVGSDSSGLESTPVGASDEGEIKSIDTTRVAGLDTVIALTTTPVLLKVGASAKADRRYIAMQGLSTRIKWGFSNSTQSFDLFNNQFFILPLGVATEVWFKVSSGTGNVAAGEI